MLAQTFATRRPNEVWVTDMISVPTVEGWLYLAGVEDLYTCEMVGHAMDARMTTDLVQGALLKAIDTKRPAPGLMHHSDRGAQYCAQVYQATLRQFGMIPSMSRKGNCYDNAPMESLWGTLKNELVHHRRCETLSRLGARSRSISSCSITGSGDILDSGIARSLRVFSNGSVNN